MNLIIDQLTSAILAKRNSKTTTVVAICGAADLGKSYLSKAISESLSQHGITANHFSLDAFLLDRQTRLNKKLSGYNIEAYNINAALEDLNDIKEGKSIVVYPYDHHLGTTSSLPVQMHASAILIFDGLHAMHRTFTPLIDISFFIYTDDEQLVQIRKEADLAKRNYTEAFSNQISEQEFILYYQNITLYKDQADYLIFLHSKWNYKLITR